MNEYRHGSTVLRGDIDAISQPVRDTICDTMDKLWRPDVEDAPPTMRIVYHHYNLIAEKIRTLQ